MRWLFAITFFVLIVMAHGQRRSALAPEPDWSELERFQETITREEFVRRLEEVYAPAGASAGLVDVGTDAASVLRRLGKLERWELRFAKDAASVKAAPRSWRTAGEMPATVAEQPLAGVKIALDPGHLGGAWAPVEERWFRIGDAAPVTEGDMTLRVAEHLAPRLRALGAEVSLVRSAAGPTTQARPEMLRSAAREELARLGVAEPREAYTALGDAGRGQTVQFQSELLFFRIAEIRHRADVVNRQLQPDVTLCLHFNSEAWGDPAKPTLVPRNHLHLLVNGCYSAGELRHDDVRHEMLAKLLSGAYPHEVAASEHVAAALAQATGLPAYTYTRDIARPAGASGFVWSRNLLANRLYRTPVLFLEPYVMNSQEVWERVQAGDYDGEREFAGVRRRSIYREYAEAVAEGLAQHYRTARPR